MSDKTAILHEKIRVLAFRLWEEAGAPEGCSEMFWLQAEGHMAGDDAGYDDVLMATFPASDPPAHSGITKPAKLKKS